MLLPRKHHGSLCCPHWHLWLLPSQWAIPRPHGVKLWTSHQHPCTPPFWFLRPPMRHMEIPRVGVDLELYLHAYTTATEKMEPSHSWDPHCSSQQHCILNPLSMVRDWTCVLIDISWVCYHWASIGNSCSPFYDIFIHRWFLHIKK